MQIAYKDQNLSKVQSKGVFITRAVSVMQTGRTLGKGVLIVACHCTPPNSILPDSFIINPSIILNCL